VRGNERKVALLDDRFTTADHIEEPPPEIPHSPMSNSPPRMPSRVGRFLKKIDLSNRWFKNEYSNEGGSSVFNIS